TSAGAGDAAVSVIVSPRPGTVSPWSSKATDIAHNCGLADVRRLERGVRWQLFDDQRPSQLGQLEVLAPLFPLIHDRMTETVVIDQGSAPLIFDTAPPRPLQKLELGGDPKAVLTEANARLGLALNTGEIAYLEAAYQRLNKQPTDAELMMFAQVNSEHCRHKIFNADWIIDGQPADESLFDMIRHTYKESPGEIRSAYRDNSAVTTGSAGHWFAPDFETGRYQSEADDVHLLMKVETHNHPTAISPFPGAATGSGGEIRDEGATGRGSRPKAGLVGFSVADLNVPGFAQPWEQGRPVPEHLASALQIMLEGPIGAASYNNEFGRPALAGYFRTLDVISDVEHEARRFAYHKPIMLAGGLGNIRGEHIEKGIIAPGDSLVVLGGPAMLIGLGGGAASSLSSGSSDAQLDFASVQRENAEMERRCQEVINACTALAANNPITSIHDVGAGGLSNALPELVNDSGRGAHLDLRNIPSSDPSMSPMEIWCNESQERYVLGISAHQLATFKQICERERCPYAILGEATDATNLTVADSLFGDDAVALPMETLLGKPPGLVKNVRRSNSSSPDRDNLEITLEAAAERVLSLPAVADKTFLITIGDRTVTGLVSRDQMVGPWQVPVADSAVTLTGYQGYSGEAMAIGERTPLAITNAPASGRMAIGESLTNLAGTPVRALADVVLSANWMAACGDAVDDLALRDTVTAVGKQLCPALGIAIPVGKDSLSMRTRWTRDQQEHRSQAPLSLIATAFAPVTDVRQVLTPELHTETPSSPLVLLDLGNGKNRLGHSALAQVTGQVLGATPDVDNPAHLRAFFNVIQSLNADGALLAYHDRSDGGAFASVCEMAFASNCGISISVPPPHQDDALSFLFNEELGAVIQVHAERLDATLLSLRDALGDAAVIPLGHINASENLTVTVGENAHTFARSRLRKCWSQTSYEMQALRDEPESALEAFQSVQKLTRRGLRAELPFDADAGPLISTGARPSVGILREQGVNGHVEMAAAFHQAGFDAIDIHMSDIAHGRVNLSRLNGLVACGGFSYGDVLGAGGGWANAVRFGPRSEASFGEFFADSSKFVLGVCNGCQMLSQLRELIPGADHWPTFTKNRSEQFEARLVMSEIPENPSIFLTGMIGARLPIAVAHGEGRATFGDDGARRAVHQEKLVALRYIGDDDQPTERYPDNPNGSPDGITGLTTADGRFTIMMPHPERLFRTVQYSWHPATWGENGPWLKMFHNAREWLS
ncbi:MAG: phosphoribosylformylglycinamidine synthase, partial [Gammaproteobacteria bacterium]|nr:phosphoribosylformylglycinamidine synthase [Gammaproteobacteria bacterium]